MTIDQDVELTGEESGHLYRITVIGEYTIVRRAADEAEAEGLAWLHALSVDDGWEVIGATVAEQD